MRRVPERFVALGHAPARGAARSRADGGAPLKGEQFRVLAEEQAALRRVATLVARGAASEEVLAAVKDPARMTACLAPGFPDR